jgi:hypothetical protein
MINFIFRSQILYNLRIMLMIQRFLCFFIVLIVANANQMLYGQYSDNPLKGQRWCTLSGGLGNMDYISWGTGISYSKRGETLLTQVKLAFSQEFIESAEDTCTAVKNRLIESGIMWGDGYAWKHAYVSGSLGFGFNIRYYCDQGDFEDRYLSALTVGLPAQIEAGIYLGKHWAAGLVLVGNWNLRSPYVASYLGVSYRLKKQKSTE